jgi:cell wall-associated NlpC family hydrolase
VGKTVEGVVYQVPHRILKPVPARDTERHSTASELTASEKAAANAAAAQVIAADGLTGKVTERSEPTAQTDCHGLTLDGGNSFVDDAYAEDLARQYGYKPLLQCPAAAAGIATDLQPGDIIIYRDKAGRVTHSATFKGYDARHVAIVHSKWGTAGDYDHEMSAVPAIYGRPEVWRKC